MNLNRPELRKMIYDFNSISNRLMRVAFVEYDAVLAKFLAFLDGTEIIRDYIQACGEPTYDIAKEISEIVESYGHAILVLGDTEQEEVANIYALLKYICENSPDNDYSIAVSISLGYSSAKQYQEKVKGFNERVVMVLIRYIEAYLTKIGIDMGMDETVRYTITVNGGQANVAMDNATINAVQNNGVDVEELKRLIAELRASTPADMSEADKEDVGESIETIESEMVQPKPKKSLVKTAIKSLQAVKGTAEFAAAVVALVQFLQLYC